MAKKPESKPKAVLGSGWLVTAKEGGYQGGEFPKGKVQPPKSPTGVVFPKTQPAKEPPAKKSDKS